MTNEQAVRLAMLGPAPSKADLIGVLADDRDRVCNDCKHWYYRTGTAPKMGDCRANPPAPSIGGGAVWPGTRGTETCGAHEFTISALDPTTGEPSIEDESL